jgi:hypothetical protein
MITPVELLSAAVDVLAVLFIAYSFVNVGLARGKTRIDAPAVTGHPTLERAYRVQMNTVEQAIMSLARHEIFSSSGLAPCRLWPRLGYWPLHLSTRLHAIARQAQRWFSYLTGWHRRSAGAINRRHRADLDRAHRALILPLDGDTVHRGRWMGIAGKSYGELPGTPTEGPYPSEYVV